MPELPEVETVARGLAKRIRGEVIESVWLGRKKDLLKSSAAEIAATLENRRIAEIRRMGKHIVFDLEANGERPAPRVQRVQQKLGVKAQWIVHLGMTGRLRVCEPMAEIEKHTHAILRLSSGNELRFVDPRRFGRLSIAKNADFSAGGVEPLEVDRESFARLFRGRKTPIKSALLNQKLLRGVGNIYADESLFRARIRPRRRASSLTRDELTRLFHSIREVLKEAIALGGSSISDYVDADGEEGFFQLQHRVYGREGEPCLVCETPIKRVVIAGRSSHYCPRCQK
ncbi:MAG TPA: bifunctional DNA-formamidopyrimidine glycosylase/DNA-(apurinic or apyrimidinic site) lyase [Verrucomicrobiae bacterium]|nr:bifunctional DNA-formamidopyrimidine glycosylase/DNA-(apurinic or apyrimidinic site) lyase [Verrucomicrobiae bacterium]